jgi:hypothetical protein
METAMNALNGLTFAAMPRLNGLTPQQKRRNKLIAHLQEQLAMAKASAAGTVYVVKKRRWEYSGDGQKHLVEVDKRLKQWWRLAADGKLLFVVRYGAKAIEFEKGKDAIVVADVAELTEVLPKLIAATEAGELDTQINAITKVKQPVVMKR